MKEFLEYFEIPSIGNIIKEDEILWVRFGKKFGFRKKNLPFWHNKEMFSFDIQKLKKNKRYYLVLGFKKYIFIELCFEELISFIKAYKPIRSSTDFYFTDLDFTRVVIKKMTMKICFFF